MTFFTLGDILGTAVVTVVVTAVVTAVVAVVAIVVLPVVVTVVKTQVSSLPSPPVNTLVVGAFTHGVLHPHCSFGNCEFCRLTL